MIKLKNKIPMRYLARHLTSIFMLTMALVLATQPTLYSLTADERRSYTNKGIYFIDELCTVDSTDLTGSDNIEKAFNFFVGKGLSAAQTSGILGNFLQESGMNPTIHQNNASKSTHPIDTIGFGIAQWTFTSRQAPLVALAESKKVLPNTLPVQLEYVWQELNGNRDYALVDLKKQTTAEASTRSFHTTFEGSADGATGIQERVDDANRVLAKYGSIVEGATSGAGSGCATGSGILVGEYAFPLAPQTKRNYGYTLPCGGSSVRTSGPHTINGVYTDTHGKSTSIRPCHHDATPAFDLSYGDVGGKPIYAITTGNITRVNPAYVGDSKLSGRPCNSITFKADTETDKSYYWYGHIIATRGPGDVRAGDVIGYVAPSEYGPKCWQGGVHLHIDRGCVVGGSPNDYLYTGDPQTPGGKGCRDPGFLDDLTKIWEALPAE